MKKIFTLLTSIVLVTAVFAQAPSKMSYQAIIRDASNTLLENTSVGIQVSILQGSPSGSVIFAETHAVSTNANGLLSLEIGMGSATIGTFENIDWGNGPYFVLTETDPEGGSNYTISNTSQLLSVPYALHANTAGNVFSGSFDDLSDVPTDLRDGDDNTQLTESEVDGFVANNGYLTSEVDGSISNEIQDLELTGNILTITKNGTATTIDLSPYLDDTDTKLTESEVDAFVANNGYITSEIDGSISNEIQDLSIANDKLSITNNGSATSIDLSIYKDNTDDQTLGEILGENTSAGNNKITNLADPTAAQDAATKAYVDANASGGSSNLNDLTQGAIDIQNGALVMPLFTTAERNALTPTTGTVVFNSDENKLQIAVATADMVNQTQDEGGSINSTDGSKYAQNFTATSNTNIQSVRFTTNNTGSFTVRIYQGSGNTGSLLHTQSVSASLGSNEVTLNSSVAITDGQVYTLQVDGAQLFFSGLNPYPQGSIVNLEDPADNGLGAYDFNFSIKISDSIVTWTDL